MVVKGTDRECMALAFVRNVLGVGDLNFLGGVDLGTPRLCVALISLVTCEMNRDSDLVAVVFSFQTLVGDTVPGKAVCIESCVHIPGQRLVGVSFCS